MKQEVKPILLLDMGINGMYAVNAIKNAFPFEDIYYLNDLECNNYEGLEVEQIEAKIKNLASRIKKYNPKMLVVVNDTLIEYGREILQKTCKELKIPFVNIVDEICNHIKEKFDSKDMAFLAPFGIIESNIYQKNFVYARLFNLNADNMAETLFNASMKTSESFNQVKMTFMPLYKKKVDVIIPTLPNILLFKTEIFEYANQSAELLDINDLLVKKVKKALTKIKSLNTKKIKYVYLITKEDVNKKHPDFVKYNKIIDLPFKSIVEELPVKEEKSIPSFIIGEEKQE